MKGSSLLSAIKRTNLLAMEGICLNLSAIKSAALFDGAQTRIYGQSGSLAQYATKAAVTEVFPVPAGP